MEQSHYVSKNPDLEKTRHYILKKNSELQQSKTKKTQIQTPWSSFFCLDRF